MDNYLELDESSELFKKCDCFNCEIKDCYQKFETCYDCATVLRHSTTGKHFLYDKFQCYRCPKRKFCIQFKDAFKSLNQTAERLPRMTKVKKGLGPEFQKERDNCLVIYENEEFTYNVDSIIKEISEYIKGFGECDSNNNITVNVDYKGKFANQVGETVALIVNDNLHKSEHEERESNESKNNQKQ